MSFFKALQTWLQRHPLLKRLLRHPGAAFGLFIVCVYVLLALAGPALTAHDPLTRSGPDRLLPFQNTAHPLGTDERGRDLLSRLVWGARLSLLIQVVAVGISLLIGGSLGLLAGYVGRVCDLIIMRTMDLFLSFPGLFLAIALAAIIGQGLWNVTLAVGIFSIPQFARVMRSSVLVIRERDFIEAARALGQRPRLIVLKHILPNALTPVLVHATLRMATVLITAAGLSFLGLGVRPPHPEWGLMLSAGRTYLITGAPHIALLPALAIVLVVFGFNLLGDGLRDALDPKRKR